MMRHANGLELTLPCAMCSARRAASLNTRPIDQDDKDGQMLRSLYKTHWKLESLAKPSKPASVVPSLELLIDCMLHEILKRMVGATEVWEVNSDSGSLDLATMATVTTGSFISLRELINKLTKLITLYSGLKRVLVKMFSKTGRIAEQIIDQDNKDGQRLYSFYWMH